MDKKDPLLVLRGKGLLLAISAFGIGVGIFALLLHIWELAFMCFFASAWGVLDAASSLSTGTERIAGRLRAASKVEIVGGSLLFLAIATLLASVTAGVKTGLLLAILPLAGLAVWAIIARGARTADGDRDD